MATIKITDQVGVTVDAQLGPKSAWAAYAVNVADVLVNGVKLQDLEKLKLTEPAVRSLKAGLAFSQPVTLGTNGPQLTIKSDAGASFQVVSRSKDNSQLLPADDLGDNIDIPAGTCYAAFGFTANAGAGISTGTGLTFGVTAGGGAEVCSYRQFPESDSGPDVLDVLRQLIGDFVLPVSSDDLDTLPAGAVVTVKGTGNLKFSAEANLLAITNPLASATLPSPLPALSIKQAASVTVGANWAVSTEYQVRVHKVAEGRARLAWFRKRDSDFTVSASASAGLSVNAGSFDLFPKVIQAISADSKADLSALSEDQRKSCEKAIKDAVNRNLQVALEADLGALRSEDAMFLYDVNLAALDDPAKEAVKSALSGDLTALATAAGVTEVQSVHTKMQERHFALKINLLGIFNFGSVSRLALESKATFAASTGELMILDKASAERIDFASTNFGPDEDKVRMLLSESFLITAAYRTSGMVTSPPKLESSHVFFRLDAKTDSKEMRGAKAIAGALGFPGPDLPAGVDDFGHTTVLAETHYDDTLSHALFLHSDGTPRSHAEYEAAGRRAFQLLLLPDGDDAFRLKPMNDDALWANMKSLGQPNFRQLFPETQAPVIAADYSAIIWWADTMCKTGGLLARIAAEPQLREDLAHSLRDVAGRAHDQFGKPWGLVSMFLASGSAAPAEVRISGKVLTYSAGPPLAVAKAG